MGAAFGNLVGIDLGTTMSVIAHVDATGRAVTLPNRGSADAERRLSGRE